MAKKKEVVKLPIKIYTVLDTKVDKMLGPHKILHQGQNRVVALNEKQAKYYLTIGAVAEA